MKLLLCLLATPLASSFAPSGFAGVGKIARGNKPLFGRKDQKEFEAEWEGGFSTSNPAFAYPPPSPDLSGIEPPEGQVQPDTVPPGLCDNMMNIDKLTRMQKVLWPQFSWLTKPGDPSSRCYQMFAPDISRLGYDNEGRVWSIICPQQGFGSNLLGNMNVEVTVTGQRGWCDEPGKSVAADMAVVGKIWFSSNPDQRQVIDLLIDFIEKKVEEYPLLFPKGHKFPFTKEDAIIVKTHKVGDPNNPIFELVNGLNTRFQVPNFATHWDEAYNVAHLDVQIGNVTSVGLAHPAANAFNQFVVDIFNLGSGNILRSGNTLSWNVWFTDPERVDIDEWRNHAEVWRESLEVEHTSPTGDGVAALFYDGTPFNSLKFLNQELHLLRKFLKVLNEIMGKKEEEETGGILDFLKNLAGDEEVEE